MELQGKGLWAWRLWELDRALTIAPEMGITHVLYKIGQGPLGNNPGFVINNSAAIAQRIRQAGYIPFAWSFTTLGDADFEAQMAIDALNAGYEGFIFNAEDATKGRREAAITVGQQVQAAGVDLTRLYLCSYPTPITHHPTIPFNEMGRYCQGGLMPMAYGTYLQPPEIVIDRWTFGQNTTWMNQQGLQLPIYAVLGPYYDNFAQQPMTGDVLQTWLDRLAQYTPSFFSVYTAAAIIPEHHAPIRAFVLSSGSPTPQTAWISSLGGAALFSTAGKMDTQFAAITYSTKVQRLGSPITVAGVSWQRIRAGALEGWLPATQLSVSAPGAWPALPPQPIPPTGRLLTVWSTAELNTRSQPTIRPETLVGRIPKGARLRVVQDTDKALQWVGRSGFWLRAQVEPGGPTIWVAAWYLSPFDPLAPTTPGLRVQVHNPQDGFLTVRSGPSTAHERLGQVLHETLITSLESDAETQRKAGKAGDWLRVRTPQNLEGYVAAQYLRLPTTLPRPAGLTVRVHNPQDGFLTVRNGPSTAHDRIGQVPHETLIASLESDAETERKVGKIGEWLQVRTPEGLDGYVAAWYLQLHVESVPEVRYLRVESPEFGLHLRPAPDPNTPAGWWLPHATILESLEPPAVTATKLGQAGAWLNVRSPSQREGFAPVESLQALTEPDNRRPVNDATLPLGRSAWLFGMHAADIADDTPPHRAAIRQLFESKNRRGWVLFTQAIGSNPDVTLNPELRQRLWDWATTGYGVIVRLNHSYHPSGTLPESPHYDAFAATCARWVELYLRRDEEPASRYTWILQIGNEQNNPSEHPGDAGVIRENITPQLYAQAFNKVYTAIKAILPRAFVAPGAIDPYNSTPMQLINQRYRPLNYFQEMLDGIPALDAFILHAYTHGPSVAAITSLETFGDFMTDHYFDFQTYRQFMERIPAKWKHVPVIIGESNHICRPPSAPACTDPALQGWINANIGWVRAAYQEIQNWNSIPHIQQIHGLLLYRWLGDQWELHNKDQILADFSQAMDNDYRWRR